MVSQGCPCLAASAWIAVIFAESDQLIKAFSVTDSMNKKIQDLSLYDLVRDCESHQLIDVARYDAHCALVALLPNRELFRLLRFLKMLRL